MFKKSIVILIIVLFACFLFTPSSQAQHPQGLFSYLKKPKIIQYSNTAWQAKSGDYMVADTQNNRGYLINPYTQTYTSFDLLSGQRRNVCYIGRCYYAATPERTWVIKQKDIKGNRYTFGPTGEFLRLFYKDKPTPYGIHSHKYFQNMLNSNQRFRSMGCIIVSDPVEDLIERSYLANNNELKVISTNSFDIKTMFPTITH